MLREADPPPSITAVRAYARTLTMNELAGQDTPLPPFPDGYGDYLRMGPMLRNLTPREYQLTSRLDYEMAVDVCNAWDKGVADARDTHAAMKKD